MIFRLLAPAIIPMHKKIEDLKRIKLQNIPEESEIILNRIDLNIFRTVRPKIQQNQPVAPLNPEENLSPGLVKKKQKPKFLNKTQKRSGVHPKKPM